MTRYDVVVVGAGAMGAAAAWQLARQGRAVCLLEQFERGHTRGSSHGATRIFRVAYRDPLYVRLALEALPLWRELEAETGETLLEQDGQLDHGPDAAVEEVAEALAAAGRPHERLSPVEAASRWPGMRFDTAVVYSPEGGRCYADRTVVALERAAARHGAEVRFGERVERLEVRGDHVLVASAARTVSASRVVAAAGAWTARLLDGIVRLPLLTVTREQPAHFRPAEPGGRWPAFIHHGQGEDAAGRHLGFAAYGLLTPGLGVKVGEHGTGLVVDPDTRTFEPDPARLARLCGYVRTWFPGLVAEAAEVSTCLYTSTRDEHFVLDRVGPLVVCSPCSGHGFKFVPVIGRIAAGLAMGGSQAEAVWRLPG